MQSFYRSKPDLPLSENLNCLHAAYREALVGFEVCPLDADNYEFDMSGVVSGGFSALRVRSAPCVITLPTQAVSDLADDIIIQTVISGEIHVRQFERTSHLRAGDTVVYSAEYPSTFVFYGTHEMGVVRVPRRVLMISSELGSVVGKNLAEARHIGPVLHSFLVHLTGHASSMSICQMERLSTNLADLVASAADAVCTPMTQQSRDRKRLLLERVKMIIRDNLGNQELTPEKVAEISKMSTRYINRLFEDEDTSLARFIWDERIARAASMLSDPAMRRRQVSEVAYYAGFKNLSHFSTVFRERFGVTPRKYRDMPKVPEGVAR